MGDTSQEPKPAQMRHHDVLQETPPAFTKHQIVHVESLDRPLRTPSHGGGAHRLHVPSVRIRGNFN